MKTTPIVIMIASITGLVAWFMSMSINASNPSLNGIVFGGFWAVMMLI